MMGKIANRSICHKYLVFLKEKIMGAGQCGGFSVELLRNLLGESCGPGSHHCTEIYLDYDFKEQRPCASSLLTLSLKGKSSAKMFTLPLH